MKICHFIFNKRKYWGKLENDLIYIFSGSRERFRGEEAGVNLPAVDRQAVKLLCPFSPTKIVCVGRNYALHAVELGNQIPEKPLLFLKAPSALILSGEPIVIPSQSDRVEHEGELAIIIGKQCRKLTLDDDPFDYILGYTCLNDVTARDCQKEDIQFTRAKSFDTFCPVAPFYETDADVSNLLVQTRVNGELRQSGFTSEMVFPVDFLVRYISNQMTLKRGDLIATGTPAGVSKLFPGDVCEVSIERIGTLTNPVICEN
ncbi:MAG: fumarylacetoacetate hydrolase family protein [Acidobacteria bacterium]|nr:fumarylacetoacetate hydrolase family protein [Acidobacteriota bacterium]